MAEALFIPEEGECKPFPPQAGKFYSLEELQKALGGLIEVIRLGDSGRIMIINEEGKLNALPINRRATQLFRTTFDTHDFIVGPAIFCDDEYMKKD